MPVAIIAIRIAARTCRLQTIGRVIGIRPSVACRLISGIVVTESGIVNAIGGRRSAGIGRVAQAVTARFAYSGRSHARQIAPIVISVTSCEGRRRRAGQTIVGIVSVGRRISHIGIVGDLLDAPVVRAAVVIIVTGIDDDVIRSGIASAADEHVGHLLSLGVVADLHQTGIRAEV